MSIQGKISGRIVAAPTDRVVSDKLTVLEFPLYSDRRVKSRTVPGEWESDRTGTTKIQVALKFDERDKWLGKINKGDVVEVTGSFYEREYDKKDGTKGRSLQTDYIESVSIIFSANQDSAPVENSFEPVDASGGF